MEKKFIVFEWTECTILEDVSDEEWQIMRFNSDSSIFLSGKILNILEAKWPWEEVIISTDDNIYKIFKGDLHNIH